jgi:hypothetical protein
MKRSTIIRISLLLLGFLAAVSCQKMETQEGTVMSADDARILVANLVITDDDDNITGYVTGFGLNQADPGEITIRCETFEKAQEVFRSWFSLDAVVTEDPDGSITWLMTDEEKKSQGAAVLTPGGEKGAVAHVELPAAFPVVSKILFLPAASMPENAELDFADVLDNLYFGNTINVLSPDFPSKDLTHGSGAMVVIREYDQDTNTAGILMAFPEHKVGGTVYNGDDFFNTVRKRSRKQSELEGPIGTAYRKYRKYLDPIFKNLNYLDGDRWLACRDGKDHYNLYNMVSKADNGGYMTIGFAGMYTGKTHYECWAYFFTVEKDDKGVCKVVLK